MSNISLEPLLNRQQVALGSTYVMQTVVTGPGSTTTSRQVTLTDGVAVSDTPSNGVTELQYCNQTGQNVRYGGTGIDASTGGMLYNGSTLVIKSPRSNFAIYFYQNSGGNLNLDVVEFY